MKEFGFYNPSKSPVLLNEQIEVVNDTCNSSFVVSNSKNLNSQIVANEINFYLKNSSDSDLDKAKNTLLLYEARAKAFDVAKDIDYEKKVGKNVIVVSNAGREGLVDLLKQNDYKVIELTHFEVKFIYGAVGELTAIVLREDDEFEIDCDFFLAENARDYMLKQSGCIEIAGKKDDEILELLNASSPNYAYKSYVHYDQSICQYHERRQEICGRCADICPTVAILKEDEKKHLVFSHIDCTNCGECVAVCPSGALDYSLITRTAFAQIARMYKGKTPLILPNEMLDFDINLPQNVLPFGGWSDKFLSETHLLTLLQESGSSVVIYSKSRPKAMISAIEIVNQIYELKFKKQAVYLAKDKKELEIALSKAGLIENSHHQMSEYAMSKREIFAKRLEYFVGESDLGIVYTDEQIRYAKVEINTATCTLCLSCVGACNVSALIADKKDNSIKFNPSICTACGYCELSCAEKDTIFVKRGKIELKPQTFTYYTLAQDELFKCVECGKEFATKKAVEKIAALMTPKFADFPEKIRTLYCCSDCKAKVMIKAQLEASKGEKIL